MLLKFNAKTTKSYKIVDAFGNLSTLVAGDTVEVAENAAKILLRSRRGDFEVVSKEKPAHAPKVDKLLRKLKSTQLKAL